MKTKILNLKLSELKEFPGNPQDVPDEIMDVIIDNMSRRGWYGEWATVACFDSKKKIVIEDFSKGDFFKISGNHRVRAADMAGIKEHKFITIIDPEYTWEQACKDNLMFNGHGSFNKERLNLFVDEILQNFEIDLDALIKDTGLQEGQLKDIMETELEVPKTDGDSFDNDSEFLKMTLCFKDIQEKKWFVETLDRYVGWEKKITDKLFQLVKFLNQQMEAGNNE